MVISITTSQPTREQLPQVEEFLASFLPKMRAFPGVVAIYHFVRPNKGDDSTITIWENEDALKRYRESDLVKEAMTFEKKLNLTSIREAYPIVRSL